MKTNGVVHAQSLTLKQSAESVSGGKSFKFLNEVESTLTVSFFRNVMINTAFNLYAKDAATVEPAAG